MRMCVCDCTLICPLLLSQNNSSIEVEQFHLYSWPKEGVPPTSQSTLHLIQRSRQRWKETGFNPIVIHTASGWVCLHTHTHIHTVVIIVARILKFTPLHIHA